jgi:hypothetical protein
MAPDAPNSPRTRAPVWRQIVRRLPGFHFQLGLMWTTGAGLLKESVGLGNERKEVN